LHVIIPSINKIITDYDTLKEIVTLFWDKMPLKSIDKDESCEETLKMNTADSPKRLLLPTCLHDLISGKTAISTITVEKTYNLKCKRGQSSEMGTKKSSETSKGESKTWSLQTVPAPTEANTRRSTAIDILLPHKAESCEVFRTWHNR
jgi:hypothetical protein